LTVQSGTHLAPNHPAQNATGHIQPAHRRVLCAPYKRKKRGDGEIHQELGYTRIIICFSVLHPAIVRPISDSRMAAVYVAGDGKGGVSRFLCRKKRVVILYNFKNNQCYFQNTAPVGVILCG